MTRRRLGVVLGAVLAVVLVVAGTTWVLAGVDSADEGRPDRPDVLSPSDAAPTPTGSASPSPRLRPGRGSASPSASARSTKPTARRAGARWQPRPGGTWQWQLSGNVDVTVNVPVFDIDGFENSAAVVSALHARGRKVICYINVGAAEDFRPDYRKFPASVLGASNGWDGERWVDIRRLDVLLPIMATRFDMCARKGFDAIEPDLVEAYNNQPGFPISAADQLRYNRAIAGLAHARGLSIGLKNDLGQVPQLVDHFDFAVNEQCAEFDECDALTPFIARGKAVYHVEYDLSTGQFCGTTKKLDFSSMRKKLALDASREPC